MRRYFAQSSPMKIETRQLFLRTWHLLPLPPTGSLTKIQTTPFPRPEFELINLVYGLRTVRRMCEFYVEMKERCLSIRGDWHFAIP